MPRIDQSWLGLRDGDSFLSMVGYVDQLVGQVRRFL